MQMYPTPFLFLTNFMIFPALAPNGASGAPSYSFSLASDTGMWRDGAGNLVLSCKGNDVLTVSAAGANADVIFGAGAQIRISPGTDQPAGEAILVAGTKVVNNTRITAACVVLLSRKTIGGTVGNLSYTVAAGVLTINSSNAADTSTIAYLILKVA